jgi:branched-chain amino acid transport system substrate-binding protein
MARMALLMVSVILAAAFFAPAAEADIQIGVASAMTGGLAWFGEQYERAAKQAIEYLNAKGGVLGQKIELIVGDDACDADQAVALARKLVSDGAVFVVGHLCSHSSIAAAKVYEAARILMISPSSASAKLTDEGRPNVFRVCGRDDRQGAMVADYLTKHWADKKIAVLDDGTVWGAGIANAVRRGLHERDVPVVVDEAFKPGEPEYSSLVVRMQAAGVEILFIGGYHQEAGLILREAHDRGYDLRLVANSAMQLADFPLIAGPALAGTVMTGQTDMRANPRAAEVVARFRAQGYEPLGHTLNAYATIQVWSQAVKAAGSLDFDAVIKAMHSHQFDTVLGRIGFDEKGDVTGFEPWRWYVWQADGTYVPLDQGAAKP